MSDREFEEMLLIPTSSDSDSGAERKKRDQRAKKQHKGPRMRHTKNVKRQVKKTDASGDNSDIEEDDSKKDDKDSEKKEDKKKEEDGDMEDGKKEDEKEDDNSKDSKLGDKDDQGHENGAEVTIGRSSKSFTSE